MSACFRPAHNHSRLLVALLLFALGAAPDSAASRDPSGQSAPASARAPAWPCRLVIATDLRPSVEVAWARSPTFRSQCERLAAARTLVLIHRASVVQTPRQAESEIGVSADGVTVVRMLVRLNARTVELIAHELEHVLEHLDGVNLRATADRHRSGTTVEGSVYETERAIQAGQRAAREVRDSVRSAP